MLVRKCVFFLPKRFAPSIGFILCCATGLLAQVRVGQAAGPPVSEYPVTMRQNIVAGTTPVGTKIEARLTLATLQNGTVIPEGAIFSGEVVESTAKTLKNPSHLAIRMNSVRWKKGSLPVTAYLTSWYYPLLPPDSPESEQTRSFSVGRRNRSGIPASDSSQPDGRSNPTARTPPSGPPLPDITPRISNKRVPMKDVDSEIKKEGIVSLSSEHSDIKIDKSTTYVLATGELKAKP